MQNTLKTAVKFEGRGLHSGQPVRMVVRPAAANLGIWFKRTDVDARIAMVAAQWDQVVPSRLCTQIRNSAGTEVSTIEHVMAALAGCAIHNAVIEIDGPEVPILDGSSAPFVQGLLAAGLTTQECWDFKTFLIRAQFLLIIIGGDGRLRAGRCRALGGFSVAASCHAVDQRADTKPRALPFGRARGFDARILCHWALLACLRGRF